MCVSGTNEICRIFHIFPLLSRYIRMRVLWNCCLLFSLEREGERKTEKNCVVNKMWLYARCTVRFSNQLRFQIGADWLWRIHITTYICRYTYFTLVSISKDKEAQERKFCLRIPNKLMIIFSDIWCKIYWILFYIKCTYYAHNTLVIIYTSFDHVML
jgi:hypothetical protein